MIYTNTTELIEYLKKNHLWMKKNLGQNFLVNMQALQKIISAADLKPTDKVVEIGPGAGVLTNELLKICAKVTSIELDSRLIPILTEQFSGKPNFELILGDALKVPLPKEKYKLVANIPYYITSPILNHFLNPKTDKECRPETIVLLVQKEVAQKVCVETGEHTVLSLEVQIFGKATIAGYVSKSCFFPEPKVDSAILKIEVYPEPLIKDIPLFMRTIKTAFSQRRKTLTNSLRMGLPYTHEQVEAILDKTKISRLSRPQELSIPDWQRLMNNLKNTG